MTPKQYLEKILSSQKLAMDSSEMKELQKHRKKVEELITEAFPDSNPTLRYGGSKAKGTMIKESYDLDISCYFPHEDTEPGESLKKIYESVMDALQSDYFIDQKRSSLRLRGKSEDNFKVDFHVDVVPGRFVDDSKQDAYLHQTSGEKKWLRTNLEVHINHVRDSGLQDAIRLMKLWKARNGVSCKTFVLELAVIKFLKEKKGKSLDEQLLHVWKEFKDKIDDLKIEDPANSGNDLATLLDVGVRSQLSIVASSTLSTIDAQGWEAVFGEVEEDKNEGSPAIIAAAADVKRPTRPWCSDV